MRISERKPRVGETVLCGDQLLRGRMRTVTPGLLASPGCLSPLVWTPSPDPVSQPFTQPWREVSPERLEYLSHTIKLTLHILDYLIIGLVFVALICGAQGEETNERAERGKI